LGYLGFYDWGAEKTGDSSAHGWGVGGMDRGMERTWGGGGVGSARTGDGSGSGFAKEDEGGDGVPIVPSI
jgi:hypothetical protein